MYHPINYSSYRLIVIIVRVAHTIQSAINRASLMARQADSSIQQKRLRMRKSGTPDELGTDGNLTVVCGIIYLMHHRKVGTLSGNENSSANISELLKSRSCGPRSTPRIVLGITRRTNLDTFALLPPYVPNLLRPMMRRNESPTGAVTAIGDV